MVMTDFTSTAIYFGMCLVCISEIYPSLDVTLHTFVLPLSVPELNLTVLLVRPEVYLDG